MPTTPTSAPLPGAVLLRVTGADRVTFLHRMLTCEVKALAVGGTTRGLFLTQKGKVVADFALAVGADAVHLLAPPAARDRLRAALARFVVADDVVIEETAPVARTFLGTPPDLPAGTLLFPTVRGGRAAVDAVGAIPGEPTISAAALEVLRVEAGESLLGAEATEETLPQECGLDHLVSYTKGCFLGQEPVARLHAQGHANRGLAGLVLDPGGDPPAPGTPILDGAREVGRVTSVAGSMALGILRLDAGDRLTVAGHAARRSPLPFPGTTAV